MNEREQITKRHNEIRKAKKSAKSGGVSPQMIARSPWSGAPGEVSKVPSVVRTISADRTIASGTALAMRAVISRRTD